MSETARKLFEGLRAMKDTLHAGLQEGMPQVKAELSRLGTQGAMELASALFSGQAFVPYGPGQYTPSPTQEHAQPGHERSLERGLER